MYYSYNGVKYNTIEEVKARIEELSIIKTSIRNLINETEKEGDKEMSRVYFKEYLKYDKDIDCLTSFVKGTDEEEKGSYAFNCIYGVGFTDRHYNHNCSMKGRKI